MLSVECQHPSLLVVGGSIMKLLLLLCSVSIVSVLGEAQEVRIEDNGKEGRSGETQIGCGTPGESGIIKKQKLLRKGQLGIFNSLNPSGG